MISRKDLAKEFELVVQQEIKNYNDTVLTTNISLNKCNQKIDDLSKEIEGKFSTQENRILEKESKFNIYKDHIDKSISEIIKTVGDLELKLISSLESSLNFRNRVEERYSEKEELYTAINKIGFGLTEINSKIYQIKEDFAHQIESIRQSFKDEMEKLKKELTNKPSEIQLLKEDLERKIESTKVDSEGILKELKIYKKDCVIIEKKIENIYTLIERINKRIPA